MNTLTISLPPVVDAAIRHEAERLGVTPEQVVVEVLQGRRRPPALPFEPLDEFERRLAALGKEMGAALPDSAFDRGALYDR